MHFRYVILGACMTAVAVVAAFFGLLMTFASLFFNAMEAFLWLCGMLLTTSASMALAAYGFHRGLKT